MSIDWNAFTPATALGGGLGGLLYSGGLRQLVLVAPLVGAVLYPGAGPVAAVMMVGVLLSLDRYGLDHLAAEDIRSRS